MLTSKQLDNRVRCSLWLEKNRDYRNQYFKDRYRGIKPVDIKELRQAEKEYEQIKLDVKRANMRLSDETRNES